tara:strand:+ start:7087 stop:8631 length:1545 start_codon:yes stop_codon:yes gene_type:complete
MPTTDLISPFVVSCAGGLTLNKDVFSMQPGEALQLQNFEPDIEGGYRRVQGNTKYNTNIVPQVVSVDEKVVMSAIFNGQVYAGRGGSIQRGASTGSWTSVTTGLTTPTVNYNFRIVNFNGTEKLIVCTTVDQYALSIDTSNSVTTFNGTNAPEYPKYVEVFKDHVFYAGMTSNPEEVIFSEPFNEDGFLTANGAGSFRVDTEIVGLKVFRDVLYIFGKDKIFKLAGSSKSDFVAQPVTRQIGCLDGGSIQELGGDIIFLAPDGLRTVAGTDKIGDVELGSISRQIQARIDEITFDRISSLVIRSKSQYRIFYPEDDGTEAGSKGIIAVLKTNSNTGSLGFEYADIVGFKPSCTDSEYNGTDELIVYGGYDGFVYKFESGNVITRAASTENIVAFYRSPDMVMGDPGIRKYMQRVNLNYEGEGRDVNAQLSVKYDYGDTNTPQPQKINITAAGGVSLYGSAIYGTGVYDATGIPLVRQSVEGSGFAVALKIDDNQGADIISIKGFQLEFTPGGRR